MFSGVSKTFVDSVFEIADFETES